jgi:hypothetical protein
MNKLISLSAVILYMANTNCLGVDSEFRLFPLDGLNKTAQTLVRNPAKIVDQIQSDQKSLEELKNLAEQSRSHMIIGTPEKNAVALKNWAIFYNACNLLGGDYKRLLENEIQATRRSFEAADCYADAKDYPLYLIGVWEQLATFDSDLRKQLIQAYRQGQYRIQVNDERAKVWEAFVPAF